MATSILYAAPAGVKGDISRAGESNVEPIMQGAQFPSYGQPVKFDSNGQAVPFSGGAETKVSFQGILVRGAPAQSGNTLQGLDDTIPWLEQAQGLLVRGYAIVKCVVGTPIRGGIVYLQIIAAGGYSVGDIRATADGGNTIALDLDQAEWATNGKDADGLAEVRVKG